MVDKAIAWLDGEPVRTRVYPVLAILLGVLVTKGIVDGDTASIILSIAGALLGVTATEMARLRVTPVAPPPEPLSGRHEQ